MVVSWRDTAARVRIRPATFRYSEFQMTKRGGRFVFPHKTRKALLIFFHNAQTSSSTLLHIQATLTMTKTSSTDLSCRAALSINNMAVSMLELGRVGDAIAAFKDSIAIMRSLMVDNSLEQTVPSKLQACTAKLARAQQQDTSRLGVAAIEVSPIDDGDVTSMKAALSCMSPSSASSTMAVFPIRLRCAAFEKNLELQAATVLYNMGIAHLVGTYKKDSSSSKQHQSKKLMATGAMRNLSLAHSLFRRNIHNTATNVDNNSTTDHAFQRLCAMLVSALVLKNMFRVFQFQKQVTKAQQVLAASLSMVEAASRARFVMTECLASSAA